MEQTTIAIRAAIRAGRFADARAEFRERYAEKKPAA